MRSPRLLFSFQIPLFPLSHSLSFLLPAGTSQFFDAKMPPQALYELLRPACWSASGTRSAELGLPIWPLLQARL